MQKTGNRFPCHQQRFCFSTLNMAEGSWQLIFNKKCNVEMRAECEAYSLSHKTTRGRTRAQGSLLGDCDWCSRGQQGTLTTLTWNEDNSDKCCDTRLIMARPVMSGTCSSTTMSSQLDQRRILRFSAYTGHDISQHDLYSDRRWPCSSLPLATGQSANGTRGSQVADSGITLALPRHLQGPDVFHT